MHLSMRQTIRVIAVATTFSSISNGARGFATTATYSPQATSRLLLLPTTTRTMMILPPSRMHCHANSKLARMTRNVPSTTISLSSSSSSSMAIMLFDRFFVVVPLNRPLTMIPCCIRYRNWPSWPYYCKIQKCLLPQSSGTPTIHQRRHIIIIWPPLLVDVFGDWNWPINEYRELPIQLVDTYKAEKCDPITMLCVLGKHIQYYITC